MNTLNVRASCAAQFATLVSRGYRYAVVVDSSFAHYVAGDVVSKHRTLQAAEVWARRSAAFLIRDLSEVVDTLRADEQA
ncbi:MAG: hypothetical protein ACOYB0_08330 [Polynucleobacter sp.]